MADKTKADQARRGNLAEGAARAAMASNGLLLEETSLYLDDAATSALLLADLEVETVRAINDAQYSSDLDVRRLNLQASEEEANIKQLNYSSMNTIPDHIAQPSGGGIRTAASLIDGATATISAGYISKNTFTSGTFSGGSSAYAYPDSL